MSGAMTVRRRLAASFAVFAMLVTTLNPDRPAAASGAAPTADAGGPYAIAEGGFLVLSAAGSTDPELDPLSYTWDLDNDGQFDDAVGESPVVSWAQLAALGIDDDGGYTIELRADDGTSTDVDSTSLTVTNTDPTVTTSGPTVVAAGQPYALTVTIDDPGADTVSSWVINWGDGAISTGSGEPGTQTHTYAVAGLSHPLTVEVTDEDGTFNTADVVVNMFDSTEKVSRYDAQTGAKITDLATTSGALQSPYGVTIGPDGLVYVTGQSSDRVVRFDPADNSFVDTFVSAGSGGLSSPKGLAFGPDGNLYVASAGTAQILRYDGSTGAFIDVFIGSANLTEPIGLVFRPEGDLIVADNPDDEILRYDASTGAFLGVLATASPNDRPTGLAIGPNGNVYAAMFGSDAVREYDAATGTLVGTFVASTGTTPHSLAFGPDGELWVTIYGTEQVNRFDGSTGASLGTIITEPTPAGPFGLAFVPDRMVAVTAGLQVNSTGDSGDATPGDGLCDTGSPNSEGADECTLRAAIQEANATGGADAITFDLPETESGHSAGVWTIAVTGTALGAITEAVEIDATTHPSHVSSPVVVVDGSSLTGTEDGLVFATTADDSGVAGISLVNFPDDGITSGSDRLHLRDNYIGVLPDGTTLAANATEPISIWDGVDHLIENNLIGGGSGGNIALTGPVSGAVIRSNVIGTDATRTLDFGGAQSIWSDATGPNLIGGSDAGDGNVLANGEFQNVGVAGGTLTVLGNDIVGGDNLGIDLATDGVTANDAGDVDAGPNDLLNFPVITATSAAAGTITVDFELDVPAGAYRIEAFTNPSGADASGYGEGEVFGAATAITHTGSGAESFQLTLPGAVADPVTLTATQDLGSGTFGATSEFSLAVAAAGCAGPDTDSDGIFDCFETPFGDTDGDTTPNELDADDDGDGTATASEGADPNGDGNPRDAIDSDRDGQPDYLDAPTTAVDGTVSDTQKISSTQGGLTGPLDNGDTFGSGIGPIGDLDGDGIVDLVVGAAADDDGGSNRGAIYVLFMNADGTVRAEQKISDTVGAFAATLDDGDFFGEWVRAVGDLDADGRNELVVGASQDDDGGPGRGAVYILFLNADGTVRAEQKISDTVGGFAATLGDGDRFGIAVDGIGDVDGDGIPDLVVGADATDDGGINRGAVYVLFMNADGTVKAEQKISQSAGGGPALDDGDRFGEAVTGPGDIDGDGTPDLVVGNYADDDGGTDRGAVRVLFLNTDGTVRAEQKISDTAGGLSVALADNDWFGGSVGGVGDLDGDGTPDLAVGTPGAGEGGIDRGAVDVLFLNADGTVKAEQRISSTAGGGPAVDDNDWFGIAVTGTGDLDGDGQIDLAVGAMFDDDDGTDRGALYVLDLAPARCGDDSDGDGLLDCEEDANTDADNDPATNPGPDTDGDTTPNYLDGDDDGDGTPTASENADPNSDGDPRDALDSDRDGQPDYLDPDVAGPSSTPVADEQKISDLVGGLAATLGDFGNFGTDVQAIGDVDGDGVTDAAVSAAWDDDGGSDRGAVYVLFLNADGTVRAEQKISDTVGGLATSLADGDLFGAALAAPGDVDGDGVPDLAVGAESMDDGGSNRGAVIILFLNADGTVRADQKISDTSGGLTTALADFSFFGTGIGGLGDLDGDGIGDIVVGANGADSGGTDRGAVFVLFLNADGTVKAEQEISDTAGGLATALDDVDLFGSDVDALGDVDGDGVTDLAVSVRHDDDGGADRGAVFVLMLNADGTVASEQKISSTSGGFAGTLDDGDAFGEGTAGPGDVDGDGIPDLIVGAYRDDDGGLDRGAIWILLLNSDGTVRSAQKISSSVGGLTGPIDDGELIAGGLSGLGDLDGDGQLNLLVSAYEDDDGGTDRGAVYVLDLSALTTAATVNSTGDAADATPGDGVCDTGGTNAEGDPECTLRAAIEESNASATIDTIEFAIPNSDPNHRYYQDDSVADSLGTPVATTLDDASITDFDPDYPVAPFSWWSIEPATDLPYVTAATTIDGTTQPGWSANTAVDGSPVDMVLPIRVVNTGFETLALTGGGATVRGLQLSSTNGSATMLGLYGTGGHTAEGLWLMTSPTGSATASGDFGIYETSGGNQIGGPTPADLVLVGDGFGGTGVDIGGDGNTLQNLWIGVSVLGDSAFGGYNDITLLVSGNDNVIGTAGAGVISATSLNGQLYLTGDRNTVQGSRFGMLADGSLAPDNRRDQVYIGGVDNMFGGVNPGEGNIVVDGTNQWETVSIVAGTGHSVLGSLLLDLDGEQLYLDLSPNGPTPNDAGDVDTGVNDLLNFPVITSVTDLGATLDVGIELDVPAGAYRVEIFANDPTGATGTGYGAGDAFVGAGSVAHTGSGVETFTINVTDPGDAYLSATTTQDLGGGDYGSTSEFGRIRCVGDADGDGLCDDEEDANTDGDGDPTTNPGPNTDGDALANFLDADDDGDGTPTASENADPNGDGDPRDALDTDFDLQPDYLDVEAGPSTTPVSAEQKISSLVGGLTGPLSDGEQFGNAVNAIGDIDGDGINDLAVGAPGDGDGGIARGAVHVLFLNADGTVRAEQKISSTQGGLTGPLDDSDLFGFDVAGLGDLDGDGIGDIVVGAFGDDDGAGSAGAVYVLFLNDDGTVKREQKLSETQGGLGVAQDAEDRLGNGLAGIGDLDGDGVVDLAIGVPRDDDGGTDRGAVHIVFLNPDGTAKAQQKISDTAGGLTAALADSDWFGLSVSSPGDVDGDGVGDLIVGAPQDDDGGTDRGAAYVLLLNTDGTVKAEQKISQSAGDGPGLDDGDNFGDSVSGVGDIDGNGIGDVLVGAGSDDDGGTDRGAVYLLQLDPTGSAVTTLKISATAGGLTGPLDDGDRFGYRATGLGDLDGDGTLNLAVGAYNDDDGGSNRGAIYVLDLTVDCITDSDSDGVDDCWELQYGDTDGDSTPNEFDADDDGDGTPTASENADPNGDGDPRDAVDSDRDGQPDWLDPDVVGPSAPPIADEQKISDLAGGLSATLDDSDFFGYAVASIGDIDGDGIDDLAVTATADDDGGPNHGAVYILFMNADGTVRAEQKISSTTGGLTGPLSDNDHLGAAVAGLGDIDGDGIPDIAIGAGDADAGGIDRGSVFIVFLHADGTVKAEQEISSTDGGLTGPVDDFDYFGYGLTSPGDLDGDGINDLVVGSPLDDDGGVDRGAVYIVFLNANGTVKAEQKISDTTGGLTEPIENSDLFGTSVTGLGDLDGDGIADLVVSADRDDDGGSDQGAAYVLFLNADGTVKAEQKISATTGGFSGPLDTVEYFGTRVAGVGDFDGDGNPDVAISARYDDDGGPNRGAVYLLALNADGTVKTEHKISSTAGGLTGPLGDQDYFGQGLAGLGDLDGDGTLNLAVGAPSDGDGGTNRGAVYILDLSPATTVVVNDTGDGGDANPGDLVCSTGGANSDGAPACTLRAAIEEANASSDIGTIDFAIPTSDPGHSGGVWTITPTAAYPNIIETVDLDARTQPGWAGTPIIEIDGSATTAALGLHASSGAGTTIAGFSIGDYTRPIAIQDPDAIIQGNWIGVRADGTSTWTVQPENGIRVINVSDDVRIGGSGANEGNVVVNATAAAVYFWNSDRGIIEGNIFGRLPDGTTAAPNATGIQLDGFSSATTIGGTSAAAANLIADNTGDAIEILSGTGHAVLQNTIVGNGGLAIDLVGGTEDGFGVTANDAGDPDTGANDLLNHAVITGAGETAGTVTVDFDLDAPAGDYVAIVSTNPYGADASGHGEAEVHATTATFTHTGSGVESFVTAYSGAAGDLVSLTVTEDLGAGDYGSTSEMSPTFTAALVVSATVNSTGDAADATPGDAVCDTGATNSEGDPECTLRAAIQEANASAIDTLAFDIPTSDAGHASGVWTIAPATEYPEITAAVTIDASTQTGYSMPVVQLEGSALASTSEHGFTLAVGSDASTIRGLAIVDFPGIGIHAEGSDDHVVVGNHLGIEADGTTPNGNRYGIYISGSSRTRIGGTTAADRNVIGANTSLGIAVYDSIALGLDSLDVVITGNYVGTDATGMLDRGNATRGIFVVNGSSRAQIGGPTAAHANLVSGNGGAGIYVGTGSMTDSVIEGNLVGITADQSAALPNDGVGIEITWSMRTIVTGNVVGSSGSHGIALTSADDAVVTANTVGTDTTETASWSIGGDGIHVASFTDNATIGGPGGVSDTNVVVNATGHGVYVDSTAGTGNTIIGNRISGNGGLAIDLEGGTETTLGVTANDAGDADTGPNGLLNHPVITAISEGAGIVSVDYDVDVPAGTYRVEVFSNATPDPSGHGEAPTIETAATITHTGSGAEAFSIATPGTATDAWTLTITEDLGGGDYGSTSEMSGVATATAASSVVVNSTGDTADQNPGNGYCATGDLNADGDAECTLRAAIAEANARTDITTITFAIPTTDPGYVAGSPAYWVISPSSSPHGSIDVDLLDATTQPGWVDQPIIELDGSLRSGNDDGIQAGRTGMEVRGLAITNWPDDGAHTNRSNVVFAGNWFGIDPAGAIAANGTSDLVIWGSADSVVIGGTGPGDRNVFAAAGSDDGVHVIDNANGVQILGNTFGLGGDGISSSGPAGNGIVLAGTSTGTVIDDNLFANTPNAAIDHYTSGTVTITGNVFGEDATGAAAPFNTALWAAGTGQITFGGTSPADANTITNSTGDGISIVDASATVTILGNAISNSSELGIDIGDDGVSANDATDADAGPNDFLNFPVITAAAVSAGSTSVDFDLDVPAGDYRIEFFANPNGADVSSHGEGETFLGATTITHTGSGVESFSHTLAAPAMNLSTTATEDRGAGSYGVTSEFSATVVVTGQDNAVVNSTGDTGDQTPGDHVCDTGGTNADGDPECTLRAAIEESNASSIVENITFAIPATDSGHSAGVWTISPSSGPYVDVTGSVAIDGTTQPGWTADPVIGLDGTAYTAAPDEADDGLELLGNDSTIAGLAIYGFADEQIKVEADRVTIRSSWLGVSPAGTVITAAVPTTTPHAFQVRGDDFTFGGPSDADGNVVASAADDAVITGTSSGGLVENNHFGVAADGVSALSSPGSDYALRLRGTSSTTVRDNQFGNLPSGAIRVDGSATAIIVGNLFGTDPTLTASLPTADALQVRDGATVRFGGTGPGDANTVRNATGDAIDHRSGSTGTLTVLGNSIVGSGGLAFDIDQDGVTTNDAGDVDSGPNELLNFPVITAATESEGTVTVTFDLDVPVNGDGYRVEFFTNPSGANASGYGEGETLIGSSDVAGPVTGATFDYSGVPGDVITATATVKSGADFGATSEFSNSLTVRELGTVVLDPSSRRSDLLVGNGASPDQTGLVGTAVATNGGLLTGPALDLTSDALSLSAIVRADGLTGDDAVISKRTAGGTPIYELGVDGATGEATGVLRIGGTSVALRGGSITAGTWHDLTLDWNGSDIVLFVDGAEVDRTIATGPLATDPTTEMTIGGRDDRTRLFDGRIDHVRIATGPVGPAAVTATNRIVTDPSNVISVGEEQRQIPGTWGTTTDQARSGGQAASAPTTNDTSAAAWLVADGIDEPGVVFESFWWLEGAETIEIAAGTRTGIAPTDQYEIARTAAGGWELRRRQGATETTDAAAGGDVATGTWVHVEIWTDQDGRTRIVVDGAEVLGWTAQGNELSSGSVGLRVGALPDGANWYVDDARARRLVTPEPIAELSAIDRP